MRSLKISIVTHHSQNENDSRISEFFLNCINYVKSKKTDFPFDEIDLLNFGYSDEPNLISENTIATLSPITYLNCKDKLDDKIIPIGIIKKSNQDTPYFPSFFIANKNSSIKNIGSTIIKRIYLVTNNSASGYIAPLYKLWQSGIIDTPTESGLAEKGFEVILVGSHKEVEERVQGDEFALGATGQYSGQEDKNQLKVKVILRYYYIPQDVIVISHNLTIFKNELNNWFENNFNPASENYNIISNSSRKITGYLQYNEEVENAYDELKHMYYEVLKPSNKKYAKIPLDTNITLNDLFTIFKSLKASEVWKLLVTIFGILSALTIAAYKIGIYIGTNPSE